jgi:transposase
MILDEVSWMNIRRFRALHEAGASYVEIAAEVGCDWRTVKRYLAAEPGDPQAAVPPRAPSRVGTQPRLIEPHVARIEGWLRTDLELKGSVIHERLVADHGFGGLYQRVKMTLRMTHVDGASQLRHPLLRDHPGIDRRLRRLEAASGQAR